jgi:hypothetical protein
MSQVRSVTYVSGPDTGRTWWEGVAGKDSNPRPWCCSLAINRRMTGRLYVFHSRFYTNPRLQARVLPARSEMVTTLIAQMSDLIAPIPKSTTRT